MKKQLGFKRHFSFFWFLIVLLVIIGYEYYDSKKSQKTNEQQPEAITYSEAIRIIETGSVDTITYDKGTQKVILRMLPESKLYSTVVPDEKIFLEYIQEKSLVGSDKMFPFYFKLVESKKIDLLSIVVLLWPIFLIIVLLLSTARNIANAQGGSGSSQLSNLLGQRNSSKYEFVKTDIHFEDVAGLKEEKEELTEVVDFMKNPTKYTKLGAKVPKGILLLGPPGTGKTMLAKAVAGESDVPFVACAGSEFVEIYVGAGAAKIRQLFEQARKNAPCIIFIDEIDAVGGKRSTNTSNDERHQTLEQLLCEMDGFSSRNDIIILAATNRPEALDPALMRPGRFDRKITVPLPDVKDREEILKIHSKNKPLAEDVDFKKIAHNTAGYSGADLENLLNEAALIAARSQNTFISYNNILSAVKKQLIGLKKAGRVISEKEKLITAYHEAGHAIVGKFMPSQASISEISIIPRGEAGGYTMHDTVEDKSYLSKTELIEKMNCLLGGRAAEAIVLKDISTGASNDLERATAIAREMVTVYGMDSDIGPLSFAGANDSNMDLFGYETMDKVGTRISALVKEAESKAKEILEANRKFLDEVANLLLDKETISGKELNEIYKKYIMSADNAE